MLLSEYKKRLREIKQIAGMEIAKLREECAMSNNKIELGDLVRDHKGFIRVDEIGIYIPGYTGDDTLPLCCYTGVVCAPKTHVLVEDGGAETVYQPYICEVIKRKKYDA